VIEPASEDFRGPVKVGDALLREEAREQVADNTADAMSCEDLERTRGVNQLNKTGVWTNGHQARRRIRTGI
jgi:hypothetical protein